MRQIDFSPFLRSTVGFDNFFSALDEIRTFDGNGGFPPYNIEKLSEERYRISLAVAGFEESNLAIRIEDGTLEVSGTTRDSADESRPEVLFQGIAAREFRRRFRLADHVLVREATLHNGLLHIHLERVVPEAKKPRTVPINSVLSRPNVPTQVGDRAST